MKVTQKALPGSLLELTIEVGVEQLAKAKKSGMADLKNKASIKGFRKGKAPDKMVMEHFGEEYVNTHVEIQAINAAYADALESEKIMALGQPDDLDITSHDPLIFVLKVPVMPELKVDDKYKKISVEKKEVKVVAKDVDAVIEDTTVKFTTHEEKQEKDATVDTGDRAIFSFVGTDPKTKEVLPGTEGTKSPLVIGSGQFIPGFEEELMGMKKGEKKEFDITFPEDYHHDDFKSKKVHFAVEIDEIHKRKLPEFTEEFIEQLTGKKQNLEEFKKSIKERLVDEGEQNERARQEEKFLEEATKLYLKEELPAPMVDHELENMLVEAKRNVASQGIDFDQELGRMGKSADDLKEEWREEGTKRAKQRFVLETLVDHAAIAVEDADIAAEIEKVAKMYSKDEHKEEVRRIYAEKSEARGNIEKRLTISKFFDSVLQG